MDRGYERRSWWKRGLRALAIVAWIGVSAAGLANLANAASIAGKPALAAPRHWPTESTIRRIPGRATLLFFAHTKCACTRASVNELERVLARSGERFDTHVVFSGPRGGEGPLSLRAMARAIPGVGIVDDEDETKRFGALTSGQVLVYDARDDLVFRGGLTSARGHEGESVGNRALLSFVLGPPGASEVPPSSDVFGCSLSPAP